MYMKIDEMIDLSSTHILQNIVVIRGVLPELVLIFTINGIYSSEEKELA